MNLLAFLEPLQGMVANLRQRPPPDPLVRMLEDGFELVASPAEATHVRVRWQDVERIATSKLDLFTTDCVVLDFTLRDGSSIRVSEEWPGFADLFGPLQAAFPALSPGWYLEVMTPAFEAKPTLLFQRSAA